MNKLEQAFALKLEHAKRYGKIVSWSFEPVRLKLADRCTYTPDFMVVRNDDRFDIMTWLTVEFYETKGFARDDALVKLKVAAKMYPFWHFFLVTRVKGEWKIQLINTSQGPVPASEHICCAICDIL